MTAGEVDGAEQFSASVAGGLAELDRQVQRGSLFAQAVFQRGFSRIEATETLLFRLVEALGERGVVTPDELGLVEDVPAPDPVGVPDEAPAATAGPGPDPTIAWPTVALRVDDGEAVEGPAVVAVDCAARMAVCHAVCCRLKFPLSCAEVDAGIARWDIGHPYIIRQDSDGCCTHNDRPTGGCRIYGDRPGICRTYSCAGDARIWSDFDNMVLNQAWIDEHLVANDLHLDAEPPSMQPVAVAAASAPAAAGATGGGRS